MESKHKRGLFYQARVRPNAKSSAGRSLSRTLTLTLTLTRPDEAECQIKCGDEFSNEVVGDFTKCAVTDKKCVPQRGDDGTWPVPKDETLVQKFSTEAP